MYMCEIIAAMNLDCKCDRKNKKEKTQQQPRSTNTIR
jgi:hypothetical protein